MAELQPVIVRNWDLPADLRPVDIPAQGNVAAIGPGLPTANLFGYAAVYEPANDARLLLNSCGVSAVDFNTEGDPGFWFNRHLMDQIGTRPSLMDRNYSIAPGPHKSRFGSIVGLTYVTPSSILYSGFRRHINYAHLSPLQVEYHDQLDSRLLCGALAGCYALERRDFTDQGGNRCRPWAVYD